MGLLATEIGAAERRRRLFAVALIAAVPACIAEQDLGDYARERPRRVDTIPDGPGTGSTPAAAGPTSRFPLCGQCPGEEVLVGSPTRIEGDTQRNGYACMPPLPNEEPPECGSLMLCGDRCTDVGLDPNHCGGCGQTCPTPAYGYASCHAATCSSCGEGYLVCDQAGGGTMCADVSLDRRHCGTCGVTCDGVCLNGQCQGLSAIAVVSGLARPDFALDEDFVYVTLAYQGGQIVRIPKAGGTAKTIAAGTRADRMVVHDDQLYWVDTQKGEVRRAGKGGQNEVVLVDDGLPHDIAVLGGDLYWSDTGSNTAPPYTGGSVWRMPLAGGAPQILAFTAGAATQDIAVDDTYVWFSMVGWSSSQQTGLARVPRGGGEMEVVQSGAFQDVIADSGSIYGVSSSPLLDAITRFDSRNRVGPHTLADLTSIAGPLTASESHLYFGSYRIPKCGGAVTQVLPTTERTHVSNGYIYWSDGGVLYRMPE